jgi:hypothetical protein
VYDYRRREVREDGWRPGERAPYEARGERVHWSS